MSLVPNIYISKHLQFGQFDYYLKSRIDASVLLAVNNRIFDMVSSSIRSVWERK